MHWLRVNNPTISRKQSNSTLSGFDIYQLERCHIVLWSIGHVNTTCCKVTLIQWWAPYSLHMGNFPLPTMFWLYHEPLLKRSPYPNTLSDTPHQGTLRRSHLRVPQGSWWCHAHPHRIKMRSGKDTRSVFIYPWRILTVLLYMVCHGSHQYTPNVSIYTIHGSYGLWNRNYGIYQQTSLKHWQPV